MSEKQEVCVFYLFDDDGSYCTRVHLIIQIVFYSSSIYDSIITVAIIPRREWEVDMTEKSKKQNGRTESRAYKLQTKFHASTFSSSSVDLGGSDSPFLATLPMNSTKFLPWKFRYCL